MFRHLLSLTLGAAAIVAFTHAARAADDLEARLQTCNACSHQHVPESPVCPQCLSADQDWLPASGEEARDFPIYCQRLSLFPQAAEHEAVAELFLPLK